MANEKRLIDANALWTALDEAGLFESGNPRHIAQQTVEEQPTIDAIVLPCKPGSLVYQIDIYPNDELCAECPAYSPPFPGDPGSCLNDDGYLRCVDCMTISETVATIKLILHWIEFEWFGNFVFLTREEAEAALAKMGEEREDV